MTEPLVYLNGRMVPASQAGLAVYDAGLVLGATVTEMTRTFGRRLFRLNDHLDRLFRSLEYVRINIGMSREELTRVSEELVARNLTADEESSELGLIHFVTPGPYRTYAGLGGGSVDERPTVCLHTFPLPYELWAERMQRGARLMTSPSHRHVPPQCYSANIKCRSRMQYYMADQEVRATDPQALALMLDLGGNVTETGGANFLIVERGTIVSPTLRNILPGVSRMTVIELAAELGIGCVEEDFPVERVLAADEAFLTSTPFCIMPVSQVNGTQIGADVPGAIVQRLTEAWSGKVGVDIVGQIVEGGERRRGERERTGA